MTNLVLEEYLTSPRRRSAARPRASSSPSNDSEAGCERPRLCRERRRSAAATAATARRSATGCWRRRSACRSSLRFMPRLTRALPIQTEDLPILGCYIGEETMIPDGDWDAGALKFIVNVRLGWSIMVAESDKEEAEHQARKRLCRADVRAVDQPEPVPACSTPSITTAATALDTTPASKASCAKRAHGVGAVPAQQRNPDRREAIRDDASIPAVLHPGPFRTTWRKSMSRRRFPAGRTPEQSEQNPAGPPAHSSLPSRPARKEHVMVDVTQSRLQARRAEPPELDQARGGARAHSRGLGGQEGPGRARSRKGCAST